MKYIVIVMLLLIFTGCTTQHYAKNSLGTEEIESTLSEDMLIRLKKFTDTFEVVDGVSFNIAVDLFEKVENPGPAIIELEEMARVYNIFCKGRCESSDERWDVYKALLIRRAYNFKETLNIFQPFTLTESEVQEVVSQYKLAPRRGK